MKRKKGTKRIRNKEHIRIKGRKHMQLTENGKGTRTRKKKK